ncbi:LytTR family transcriptional regulator DNA-binding domain-containing protein [Paenibacillus sp. QZ-Y1]|uniref:LytTR family transcriptional regulator DNA-binding domain-containing protein n=1 Tax=Paenibacillus sp. QZ-Y1 TaxID=3414511 RepID=UPI003F7B26A8
MNIPVIDTMTNEVKTVNVSDVMYVTRTGLNGSVINLVASGIEYKMLSNIELLRHLHDKEMLIKSDRATYINPLKVRRLNNVQMSAEFDNGKQASVSKMAFKGIEDRLSKTK